MQAESIAVGLGHNFVQPLALYQLCGFDFQIVLKQYCNPFPPSAFRIQLSQNVCHSTGEKVGYHMGVQDL